MIPGELAQLVGFDVTAADEIEQRLIGQIGDRDLGGVGNDRVGPVADFDDAVV